MPIDHRAVSPYNPVYPLARMRASGVATTSRLTVGQFRKALQNDNPVLQVTAQHDKIRMEHYVLLHPVVIRL